MKYLFSFIFFYSTILSYSQDLLWETDDVIPADVMSPKYKNGGLENFRSFVLNNFDSKKVTKEGQILISFTINVLGEMKNIRVLKATNPEAALEMMSTLAEAEKWEPAKRGGNPISINMKMPFVYKKKNTQRNNAQIKIDSLEGNSANQFKNVSVEYKPTFPGGKNAFYKYISDNFSPPNNVEGQIIITFVVSTTGYLEDFKIIKDIGGGAADRLIEFLIKAPKFKPGMQNGRPVKVQYRLPLTIFLTK